MERMKCGEKNVGNISVDNRCICVCMSCLCIGY